MIHLSNYFTMKKYLFLISFTIAFLMATNASAQTPARWGSIPYGNAIPTYHPKVQESQFWYNLVNSTLYQYNRLTALWEPMARRSKYGEMSLATGTTTISFAATTAAPVENLTVGPISGFSMVSDSVLRYTGTEAKTFSVNYSISMSFAEAANLITGYVEVNGTESARTKFKQTLTLTTETETVGGTAILVLQPGALIRFMCAPASHTGTDILTISQFNLNIQEVN